MVPMATQNEDSVFLQGNFHDFFQKWTAEQKQYLRELVSATITVPTTSTPAPPLLPPPDKESSDESGLVQRVIRHYEDYYRAKSHWAQVDVYFVFSPPWRTELENAFQWVGGWRPTMAFHLLYSKAGIQLEAMLWSDRGTSFRADDLAFLSPVQLGLLSQLQGKTVKQEQEISEEMARHQETVADRDMVELSHEATELMGTDQNEHTFEVGYERRETTLKLKEEKLKKILEVADDLRLRTLKGVIEILSPNQALHEWGKQHNDKKHGSDP